MIELTGREASEETLDKLIPIIKRALSGVSEYKRLGFWAAIQDDYCTVCGGADPFGECECDYND